MKRAIALFGAILLVTAGMAVAQEPIEPQEPQEPIERPQSPTEQPQHQMQQTEETFTGEIITVDEDAKTVTVREPGPPAPPASPEPAEPPAETPGAAGGVGDVKTFHVDTQTEIRGADTTQYQEPQTSPAEERPGMAASEGDLELKDLSEGDRVTVEYTEDAGKSVAKSIQVISRQSS